LVELAQPMSRCDVGCEAHEEAIIMDCVNPKLYGEIENEKKPDCRGREKND